MVNIIKNLFSGKDNYYIELDESETQDNAAAENTEKAKPKAEEAPTEEKQPSPTQPTPAAQPSPVENNGSNPLSGDTFAPNYLLPKATASRRRPGANMNQFLELARDVKAPRNQ